MYASHTYLTIAVFLVLVLVLVPVPVPVPVPVLRERIPYRYERAQGLSFLLRAAVAFREDMSVSAE